MKEHEKAEIKRLVNSLASEKQGQGVFIDRQLSLEDQVQVAMSGIVTPWSRRFIDSGLHQFIMDALNNQQLIDQSNIRFISLCRPIVHPWRERLYRAWFYLEDNKINPSEKFKIPIQRRPLFGMNSIVARGDKDREALFDLSNPEALTKQTHPIVTLDFASQIQQGVVWEKINRSLLHSEKDRLDDLIAVMHDRALGHERRQEYARSCVQDREEFLQKWGHYSEVDKNVR